MLWLLVGGWVDKVCHHLCRRINEVTLFTPKVWLWKLRVWVGCSRKTPFPSFPHSPLGPFERVQPREERRLLTHTPLKGRQQDQGYSESHTPEGRHGRQRHKNGVGEKGKRPGQAEQGPQATTVAQLRLREREHCLSQGRPHLGHLQPSGWIPG